EQLDSLDYIRIHKNKYFNKGKEILKKIYSKGVIDTDSNDDLILVENNEGKKHLRTDFYTIEEAKEVIDKQAFESDDIRNFLAPLLKMSIVENIIYDEVLNKTLQEKKLAEISTTKGMVKKDEKIISKGEIVDLENKLKLDSYVKKYSEQILDKSNYRYMSAGYLLLISILISILVLYLYIYKREIFIHFRQFSLIFILVNVAIFLAAMFSKANIFPERLPRRISIRPSWFQSPLVRKEWRSLPIRFSIFKKFLLDNQS
ncbi:MAG: hypothetical protein DSY93_06490, partial [SAR324 cluster bacterium]